MIYIALYFLELSNYRTKILSRVNTVFFSTDFSRVKLRNKCWNAIIVHIIILHANYHEAFKVPRDEAVHETVQCSSSDNEL